MRNFLLTCSLFFLSCALMAQGSAPGGTANSSDPDAKFQVKGKIVDGASNAPLEYATVSLMNPGDSSIVTGTITDADGAFSMNTKEGSYIVAFQFISYKSRYANITLTRENPVKDFGTVSLSPDTETLDEVVVEGQRSTMTMELDKRVFNVGEDLSNISGNASDVLNNIPSVSVDIEGAVSLRGSANVRILINGKPSGLVGIDGTNGLRNLQSNMIERVEVITNPSARYEASGNAGIINIILKKDEKQGINGTFNANVGVPHNHGAGFNLNFRKSWLNLFASYGLSYRSNPGGGFNNQTFFNEDTTYYRDVVNDRTRSELSNTFRFGSDIYMNDLNVLTLSGLYQVGSGTNTTSIQYNYYDINRNLVAQDLRFDDEKEDEEDIEFSANYTRTFKDNEDHKLTTIVQYRESNEIEDAEQEQGPMPLNAEMFDPEINQRSLNDEFESTLLLQLDYIHPFGTDGKVEAGYRGSIRDITNAYNVEELNDEGIWENLDGFTNDFAYDENIQAAYAIYGNKWGDFSFQGGLRMEITDIVTFLEQTGEENHKNYTNFFPSAHVTYELANENNLQLSYSRRIDRPGFRSLNPFSSFTDPLNIRTGNPDLDPEYSDAYEFGYLKNWEMATLYTSVYYRHSTGVNERVRYTRGDTTYTTPLNLASRDAYGVEFTFNKDVGDWWRINGTANFYHEKTVGEYEGQDIGSEALTMSTRINSLMTIWNVLETQISFNYRAPQNDTQGRRKSMYTIDLGASKDIFKGKGTLVLNVRDLLNSRRWRSEVETPSLREYGEFQWRSRTVTLTLNYRLNQKKRPDRGRDGREGGDFDGGDGEF